MTWVYFKGAWRQVAASPSGYTIGLPWDEWREQAEAYGVIIIDDR